jgi:hypothetical protein
MPTIVCPGCGRRIGIPDAEMHLTIECARCDTRFNPMAASQPVERVRVLCPGCQAGIRVPAAMVGKRVSCPKCHHAFEAGPDGAMAPDSPSIPPPPRAGTVTATCPGCGRAIPLQPHELSLTIECARCNTWFVPAGLPPPVRREQPSDAGGFHSPCEPGVAGSSDPFAGMRSPSGGPIRLPTALAIAALLSVFWLWVAALLARGPHWNGSLRTYRSYWYAVEARDRLDEQLAYLGTNSSTLFVGVLVLSLALSSGLVICNFCLWNRHSGPGRVLTIAAAVLLLPCTCCGLFL